MDDATYKDVSGRATMTQKKLLWLLTFIKYW